MSICTDRSKHSEVWEGHGPCEVCSLLSDRHAAWAERDALRAEVTALREERDHLHKVARADTRRELAARERAEKAERELAEARARLAYWEATWQREITEAWAENERARALLARCKKHAEAGDIMAFETFKDVRAFLDQRRDEARRCTCGVAQFPGLVEHTPNCGTAPSVCKHRWVKEHGVDVDWCQSCGAQRPHQRRGEEKP